MRLDQYLVKHNVVKSREKAKFLISQGFINVNKTQIKKVAFNVKDKDLVESTAGTVFVSRSGNKLEAALQQFDVNPKDFVCLDIGSSTGGFTQCLLKHKAAKIYAVDVGVDQLDSSLFKNSKVLSFEGTDIRNFDPKTIKEDLDLIVIDVSFISIKEIIKVLPKFPSNKIIALLKPQFEVGRSNIKKGVVKDPQIIAQVLEDINEFFNQNGYKVQETIKSPLKGKEGNQEYLLLVFPR